MITHDDLTKALFEAYRSKVTFLLGADEVASWEEQSIFMKQCWSAVAHVAWDLVEGENAEFAKSASQKEEALRELVVQFVNRAEDVLA
jgi:hypothetical protein